jgi:hypothetical protein
MLLIRENEDVRFCRTLFVPPGKDFMICNSCKLLVLQLFVCVGNETVFVMSVLLDSLYGNQAFLVELLFDFMVSFYLTL